MRRIEHPGPAAEPRVTVVEAMLEPFEAVLTPGRPLLDSVAAAVAAHGAASALLVLSGGALFPFRHVMPALAHDSSHAVYYSARHEAAAPVTIDAATLTFGSNDGAPWLHCHARWRDADCRLRCGHVLPQDSIVAAPIAVRGWLLRDAGFVVCPDSETNFSLFKPRRVGAEASANGSAAAAAPGQVRGLLVRLAPNVDVCSALSRICAERNIERAVIAGGVGSTVGAVFADGRVVEPFVTELLVEQGTIARADDGGYRVDIDVTLVDYTGGVTRGRLTADRNPVLVTFELALLPGSSL